MTTHDDLVAQLKLVLDTVPGAAVHPPDWETLEDFDYLYQDDRALTRTEDLPEVLGPLREALGLPAGTEVDVDRNPRTVPPGVVRLTWPDRLKQRSLPDVLDLLDDRLGRGVVTHEHLLYVCGHCCAGTEPELPVTQRPSPDPGTGRCGTGEGVSVRLYDTGLVPKGSVVQHAWMAGVTGDPDRSVRTVVRDPGPPAVTEVVIDADGGHGTFVAGSVRLEAREATVAVTDMATRAADGFSVGVAAEGELAARLVLDQPSPDIIVFSYAGRSRKEIAMLAFEEAWRRSLSEREKLTIVAPAGNDSDCRKFWPAAFEWVVGVGALAENQRDIARFSNYGPWVDVFAPGENAVNAFADGVYTYRWPSSPALIAGTASQEFAGLAVWSGTSFSAPMVAGMIAARMTDRSIDSPEAWRQLKQVADSQADPAIGPILQPGQGCVEVPPPS